MEIKIMDKVTGNKCWCCGNKNRNTEERADCPITIWTKKEGKKRGHNNPMCSEECQNKFLKELEKDYDKAIKGLWR